MPHARFALDIETIARVDDPAFDRPSHWETFAVALGYQPEPAVKPEVEVLFRRDDSVQAEARLYEDVCQWIKDRHPGDEATLVTYNGDGYDLPIIRHRVREAAHFSREQLAQQLYLIELSTEHDDLIQVMRGRTGRWVSLDDALAMHSIEAEQATWRGEPVTGKDMLEMGQALMTDDVPGLRAAVETYAESDVRPLFRLHDELVGDRVEHRDQV